MSDLLTKAQSGDLDSQYQLGRAYAFGGEEGISQNIPEAVKWLSLAGEQHVTPLHNLIGIYMGAAGTQHRNARGVIETFQKIIDIHDGVLARINLGSIYTGNPEDRHIDPEQGGLPELIEFCNPELGYRLIEEGVAKAESRDENPLGYNDYATAGNAYHHDTRKRTKGQADKCFFRGFDHFVALAKKVVYQRKSNEALKAGKGTENIPIENISALIMFSDQMLESQIGELNSMFKVLRTREELPADVASMLGAQLISDYATAAAREIAKLRQEGQTAVADVLEGCLNNN